MHKPDEVVLCYLRPYRNEEVKDGESEKEREDGRYYIHVPMWCHHASVDCCLVWCFTFVSTKQCTVQSILFASSRTNHMAR